MIPVLAKELDRLHGCGAHSLLKGTRHGIEKEGLRVDQSGALSQRPHADGLGSALTNGTITTDFSEALLELITPVFEDPETALLFLADLHRFTYSHLGEELIWAGSMPCRIPDPAAIPIARYGTSNIGRLKHIYRVGLEHRYGRMMQSIAGIHYNFSLADEFWRTLRENRDDGRSLQSFRSAGYFKMIRNLRRHSWLLMYLFGASPALDDSFLKEKRHNLQKLHDRTLYLPFATSLRMSDLGYSTTMQASLNICFNHLETYIDSLVQAVRTPYPPYEKIGVRVDGRYRQLNDTILQIENEHYSDVRPKRVARKGERPLEALRKGGVEYIEIRSTDVNPLLAVGIDSRQTLFMDTFLISCLLMNEQDIGADECRMVQDNIRRVTTRGREPGLLLTLTEGERGLPAAGATLLGQLRMTAELLDEVHATDSYTESVDAQLEKLEDASLTPSAQVLMALRETGLEYDRWILLKSREHKETLGVLPAGSKRYKELARRAAESITEQQALEAGDSQTFDQFLSHYLDIETY